MSLLHEIQECLGDAYTVEQELHGGNMSRVFLAMEHRLHRRVVVKILPRDLAVGVSIERFNQEIRLAARLQQANIVPVLTVGECQGLPYYTMPYVEGRSLRDRLDEAPDGLSTVEVVTILRDVTRALGFAHERGVIHRDIKPANILLSGGSAVVTDFGVAKALSEARRGSGLEDADPDATIADLVDPALTQVGATVGTPAYMAPEQMVAEEDIDHRSDFYALGCVAYEMLTGKSPVHDRSTGSMLVAQLVEQPEALQQMRSGVPSRLSSLVMRCLEKNADDRPQTAAEIIEALDGATATTAGTTWKWASALAALVVGLIFVAQLGPSAAATPRVVIVPPDNLTGDATLDPIARRVQDELTTVIGGSGLIEVLPGPVGVATSELGSEQRAEAARDAGASTMIAGSYARDGPNVSLQVQIVDLQGNVLSEHIGPVLADAASPAGGISALAERVAGAFAMRLDPALGGMAGFVARPPNLQAYQWLADGEAKRLQFDYVGAIASYREAEAEAEADAVDFFLPTVLAATVFGEFQVRGPSRSCASVDSISRSLEPARSRMTPFERLVMDEVMAGCRGDRNAQYEAARRRSVIAPRSLTTKLALVYAATHINRPAEARDLLEEIRSAGAAFSNSSFLYQRLIWAYHALGDHRSELATSDELLEALPDRIGSWVFRVLPLIALGRSAELEDVIAQAATMRDAGGWDARTVYHIGALEARAHGDSALSRDLADRLVEWLRARPRDQRRSEDQLDRLPADVEFDLLVVRGLILAARYAEADSVLETTELRDHNELEYHAVKGLIAAYLGEREAARTSMLRIEALRAPGMRGDDLLARSRIAAVLGDEAEALLLARDAAREGVPFGFNFYNWHNDPAMDALRDDSGFQALVAPKG